jgi:hypothetical protein
VSGLTKLRIGTAVSAALATMLVAPAVVSAGPVEDLVNQVSNGVNQTLDGLLGNGNGKTPAPKGGGGESEYVPPAHGTNPHGMGTVGIGAISNPLEEPAEPPLPYDPGGGDDEITIGQSRGEQNPDGTYHGHVTLLALFGNELVPGADTDEGESETGIVGDLNAALDEICLSEGICLSVLGVNSETDASSSHNSFGLGEAFIVPLGTGAFLGGSSGDISDDGTCQTSNGSSSILRAVVLGELGADFVQSESESRACNDGTPSSQSNDSSLLVFGPVTDGEDGEDFFFDCAEGVPNTELDLELAALFCNADDSSNVGGTQLDEPYGVREALTAFVLILPFLDGVEERTALTGFEEIPIFALIKATLSASESFAVAPPEEPPPPAECPDPANPDCPVEPPDIEVDPEVEDELISSDDTDELGAPRGPSARDAGTLPFTGSDLLVLGMIGLGVLATGLGAMALSDRRRRTRVEG